MRYTLLNSTILFLSLFVLLTSDSLGQSIKDTKRILGKWKFTETERKNRSNNVLIKIDGDSIVVIVEDDYVNYDPTSSKNLRFPVIAKRSGPKGMYFEKTERDVDEDKDTIQSSEWIKFEDIGKNKLSISIGKLYEVFGDKSTDENLTRWSVKLNQWLRMSRDTKLIGVRRK